MLPETLPATDGLQKILFPTLGLEKVALQDSAGATISPWPVRHCWGTKTVVLGAKPGEKTRMNRRQWTTATGKEQ